VSLDPTNVSAAKWRLNPTAEAECPNETEDRPRHEEMCRYTIGEIVCTARAISPKIQ